MRHGISIPLIIDVEASGFGPDSYPIEVGLALEDGRKYCTLVSPAPYWTHWDAGAEAVHRITRDILAQHGKPMARVARELNDILGQRTVYSDGWVVDHPWINKLFDASHIERLFTTSPLEMILSEPQMEIWHATKDEILTSAQDRRHRASFDASIIQETWQETRARTKTAG